MHWKKTNGQEQIVESLRLANKLRTKENNLDNSESLINRIGKLNVEGRITTRKFREEFCRNPSLPLLIGDDVFVRGIDRGIEEGVFVYERGDLIRGPGSPHSVILIDDDSIIFTIKKAKELGKWPPQDSNVKGPEDRGEYKTGESETGGKDKFYETSESETTFEAEGDPYEAIIKIQKKMLEHKITKIIKIRIESKDNVFPLLSAINKIKKIDVKMDIKGDYNTSAESTFRFEYEGTLDSTEEEREFLKNRLKNADVPNIKITLTITPREEIAVDWLNDLANTLKWVKNSIKISNTRS